MAVTLIATFPPQGLDRLVKPRDRPRSLYNPGIEVLLICTGNQCRSPMAAGLLRHRLAAAGSSATVRSAGLLGDGVPATGHAVAVLARRGVDISDHRSRRLTREAIVDADLVIGMARHHVREAILLDPSALSRTFTLRDLVRRASAAPPRRRDEPMATWLRRLDPARRHADLVGEAGADDIADPIGQPRDAYEACATEIEILVDALVPHLAPRSDVGVA
jgi:protein-tyrosine phosphatase